MVVTIRKKISASYLADLKKHRDELNAYRNSHSGSGVIIRQPDMIFHEKDLEATFDGKKMFIHKIFIPEVINSEWKSIVSKGYPQVQSYLKMRNGNPGITSQDIIIIANLQEIVFIHPTEYERRLNVKSYTHVFDKAWMEVEFGWSNKKGFMLNGVEIPQNDNNIFQPLGNLLANIYKSNKPTLTDNSSLFFTPL